MATVFNITVVSERIAYNTSEIAKKVEKSLNKDRAVDVNRFHAYPYEEKVTKDLPDVYVLTRKQYKRLLLIVSSIGSLSTGLAVFLAHLFAN